MEYHGPIYTAIMSDKIYNEKTTYLSDTVGGPCEIMCIWAAIYYLRSTILFLFIVDVIRIIFSWTDCSFYLLFLIKL